MQQENSLEDLKNTNVKTPINIFLSYAHEDEALKNELEKHLAFLKRKHLISTWSNRDIKAGEDWKKTVDENINRAEIIILLVSPDFIASDYSYGIEMQRAVKRHTEGRAQMIPIILRHVYWHDEPFSKLKVLPANGKPVTSWTNLDEALLAVIQDLQQIIKEKLLQNWLEKTTSLIQSSKFEEALALNNEVLLLSPTNVQGYQQRSIILYYREGAEYTIEQDFKEALSALEIAARLDSNNIDVHKFAATICNELGNYTAEIDHLNKALQINPNDEEIYERKAQTYEDMNNYEDALININKAIMLSPLNAEFHFKKGIIFYHKPYPLDIGPDSDYKQALEAINTAIQLDPQKMNYHRKKIDTLLKLKEYDAALITCEELIARSPESNEYYAKVDILISTKRYNEALIILDNVIETHADEEHVFFAHLDKGEIFLAQKKPNEALAAIDNALKIDPLESTAYWIRGKILQEIKLHNEALLEYKKAIEMDEIERYYISLSTLYQILAQEADEKGKLISNTEHKYEKQGYAAPEEVKDT